MLLLTNFSELFISMKVLKIIGIVILAVVIIGAIISFILPTKMHTERSIVIKAPKEVIFQNVKMYANMVKWSPWVEKDTAMKTEIGGTDGTVGAIWKWVGNKEVGEGEQTVTKIDEPNSIASDIHFIKPMEGHATSSVNLADTANGVKVTWRTDFEMPRPWNIFSLFMNVEKEMNTTFERGLAKLKDLSEKEAASGYTMANINEVTVEPKTYIGIKKTVTFDNISPFFAENMPKLFADMKNANIQLTEPMAGLYYSFDEKK